jgi:hypothetical protein
MKYRPPSIKEEGLEPYLNRTKAMHNNLGYNDFAERVRLEVSKAKIAKDFNVSDNTIWKTWLPLYKGLNLDK